MDLDALCRRLDELEREYQQRSAPLNRQLAEQFNRVNKPGGITPAEFERELRAIGIEANKGEGPLHMLLDELCASYLEATAAERAAIRAAVQARPSLPDRVRGYGEALSLKIRSVEDVDALYAALAAMSIENCGTDYRDTLLALAEIYVRAERAGIDPRPHFNSVAALSSAEVPRGGRTPVARLLRDFHCAAVVAERRGKP